ncbi:MAG TPA: 1-deoxy-D-xylulose-5-phosphate reductoisomerase [Phycisphaerales bacterium]|nr:1-deoxy-D-xylulose-5-phosphate reductoisomerase [Phycisphaerales bacterium]
MTRRVIILGSTGSIGTQTLEVIAHLNALYERSESPVRIEVVGLCAGKNRGLLEQQARAFGVARTACAADSPTAALDLVSSVECDLVVAAMVGSAGLRATLAAIELKRDIALANKETLVAAGSLIIPRAMERGVKLLPVDSEHAALWQCLDLSTPPPFTTANDLTRVILTASGGPFRTATRQQIWDATPSAALKHPTWAMGKKVSIDSASLMNKALEIIEAHWLFAVAPEKIEALVHPQSLVHAVAEFADGNAIAQLAAPDMRTPIQHALAWPWRTASSSRKLEWAGLRSLSFEPVDHERFPLLNLAYRAIGQGGTAGAILNAANEAAVGAFLEREHSARPLRFGAVIEAVLATVESIRPGALNTLDDCLHAEQLARDHANRLLTR